MRVTGHVGLDVSPAEAWRFLTDPAQISRCTPGLQRYEVLEPGRRFRVVGAVAAVGQSEAIVVPAEIEWVIVEPPDRLEIVADLAFSGRPLTVAASLALRAADPGTDLDFACDATLAQPANRFLQQMVARALPRLTERFFRCVKASLANGAPPPDDGSVSA